MEVNTVATNYMPNPGHEQASFQTPDLAQATNPEVSVEIEVDVGGNYVAEVLL